MMRVLLIDDDAAFRLRLARALTRRGLAVAEAGEPETGLDLARGGGFAAVLVDLRMPGGSGLDLIPELAALEPAPRIVLLTGFGSIPTAVEAVRRGAVEVLQKPAAVEEILAALQGAPRPVADLATPSLERVEWEHLQRVLGDAEGNISEAARRLGMHRRTLQRKLDRGAPLK